jgi:hypothetical protein
MDTLETRLEPIQTYVLHENWYDIAAASGVNRGGKPGFLIHICTNQSITFEAPTTKIFCNEFTLYNY